MEQFREKSLPPKHNRSPRFHSALKLGSGWARGRKSYGESECSNARDTKRPAARHSGREIYRCGEELG